MWDSVCISSKFLLRPEIIVQGTSSYVSSYIPLFNIKEDKISYFISYSDVIYHVEMWTRQEILTGFATACGHDVLHPLILFTHSSAQVLQVTCNTRGLTPLLCSVRPRHDFWYITHYQLYVRDSKTPYTYYNWRWQLTSLPKNWKMFKILRGSFPKSCTYFRDACRCTGLVTFSQSVVPKTDLRIRIGTARGR
jgi:hypothetical protein